MPRIQKTHGKTRVKRLPRPGSGFYNNAIANGLPVWTPQHAQQQQARAMARKAEKAQQQQGGFPLDMSQIMMIWSLLQGQKQMEEFNRNQERRYSQGLSNLRQRDKTAMGAIENFNHVREQMAAERADEALRTIIAQRASRGLADSRNEAFRQRSSRDLGMQTDQLAEMRDKRIVDQVNRQTMDTNNWIAARQDTPPDTHHLTQLAGIVGESMPNLGQQQAFPRRNYAGYGSSLGQIG